MGENWLNIERFDDCIYITDLREKVPHAIHIVPSQAKAMITALQEVSGRRHKDRTVTISATNKVVVTKRKPA